MMMMLNIVSIAARIFNQRLKPDCVIIRTMMIKKILYILPALIFLFACRKEKTTWGTAWRAPLFQDTLSFQKLIDSNQIGVQSDHSLQLTLNQSLFNADLFEYLNIPDTSVVQEFSLGFSNWYVGPGGSIPTDVTEFEFLLDDVELSEVIIKQGQASVKIENPLSEPAIFSITFPGVLKNGVPFTEMKEVPAAVNGVPGTDVISFDFSDYLLDLTGENGSAFNKLVSQLVVSLSADGNGVNITNSDVFKFTLTISELKLKYARGYFGNIHIADTARLNVKEFNNVVGGSVDFDDVNLSIQVENGVNVNGELTLDVLRSEKANGSFVDLQSPYINVAQSINAAQSNNGVQTSSETLLNFNSTNSNIESFLEHLGSNYKVGYDLEINPWGNTSGGYDEIYEGSSFGVSLQSDMPLALGIADLVYNDTIKVDLKQDLEGNHLNKGSFLLNVQNSFPFSGAFELQLLDENKKVLSTLSSSSKIEGAYATAVNSFIDFPFTENALLYTLSEEQVSLINQTSFIAISLLVDGPNQDVQQVYLESKLILELLTDFEFSHAL